MTRDGPCPDSQALRYVLKVADNFNYMDADEWYEAGRFANVEDAIATCKRIVLESLTHCYKPGMTAGDLYEQYLAFGDDPFIVDLAGWPDVPFSAWQFARRVAAGVVSDQLR